ncbi:MAG: transcription antitermination factor NusB [Porticoccaceae bacterium]|jgi:N utilization substance protein B|nr:transcription antitermination factor NusB [Porticoccaceae bacterium]
MRTLPSARKKARRLLVQALYQWQLAGGGPVAIEAQFRADNDMTKVDGDYFRDLLHGILDAADTLDAAYSPYLDRRIEELDPVSRALLRMGTYELLHRIDVPYRVAINEAVNLAKAYGPEEAHRYVNGVLDKVAAANRPLEIATAR